MPKARHIPERTCVGCGLKLPKRNLTRVVHTSEGDIRVDPSGKSAGRGAYLCQSPACWERSIGKGGLERGLRSRLSSQDREMLLTFLKQTAPSKPVPVEKEDDL